jgi:hypothetical protein
MREQCLAKKKQQAVASPPPVLASPVFEILVT